MDQEKIGKFISKCRKQKKLTQEQLAEKLGVTNKSVSRWENGKSMPDISMFNILSEELGVSINNLMSGEIVDNKNYQKEFEKNIINSVSLVQKESKKGFKAVAIIFLTIILLTVLGIIIANINIKLKFDVDKMYVEYDKQYGLRYVSKNQCTLYDGTIYHILKNISIKNKKYNIIFVNSSCSIYDYYRYNDENNTSNFRFDNFKIYDKNLLSKYKVYYTLISINEIKYYDNDKLLKIIDSSYLLYEK
jgi:transcriptional regulator with XRE-family HTH domain